MGVLFGFHNNPAAIVHGAELAGDGIKVDAAVAGHRKGAVNDRI